jgi:hypothetical protein
MSEPIKEIQEQKPPEQKYYIPEDNPLASAFSQRQKGVLLILLFIALVGLGYRVFFRGAIKLISPGQLSAISAKDLYFSWKCNRPNVSFVIEVYDNNDLMMRQIVDETSYTPDDDQKSAFEANRTYTWRVIPNPDVPQRYNISSQTQAFYITKAVPPPPKEPEAGQPVSAPETPAEAPKPAEPPSKSKKLPPPRDMSEFKD